MISLTLYHSPKGLVDPLPTTSCIPVFFMDGMTLVPKLEGRVSTGVAYVSSGSGGSFQLVSVPGAACSTGLSGYWKGLNC